MQKHKLRNDYNDPGHAHELTWSCYRRMKLLRSDIACQLVADAIDKARVTHNFAVWAFVFMPEHIHLLIHPRESEYDIALIRKAIKQGASQRAISHLKRHNPSARPTQSGELRDLFPIAFGRRAEDTIALFRRKDPCCDQLHPHESGKAWVSGKHFRLKWSSARTFHAEGDSPIKIDACEVIV
ncbi:MAG: transposase [Fimbriimonadales bacterium]|nr:transposase [Fimbriimonadales bacterium]